MTFGTAKDRDASERFMLVRLKPARLPVFSTLATDLYGTTWPFESQPVSVKRNGVELTEVAINPPTASGTWYYDADTSTLKVKQTGGAGSIVVFYYLFFTGEKTRYFGQNPENAISGSNPVAEWRPRIDRYPQFTQTIRDITQGVITIGSSSIKIINHDNDFQQYVTDNRDSFYNKEIVAWFGVDATIERVYTGKMQSIRLSNNTVTIGIYDALAQLNEKATMGEEANSAYYRRTATASFWPDANTTPRPFIFKSSWFTLSDVTSTAANPYPRYRPRDGFAAVANPYQGDISGTTNRTWYLGRTGSNGIRTQTFGSVVREHTTGQEWLIYFSGHNLEIGETVKYTTTDGLGTHYAYVLHNKQFTWSGDSNTYNCVLREYDTATGSLSTFTPLAQPIVWWWDAADTDIHIPWIADGIDFTHYTTALPGGTLQHYITFVTNAENGYAGASHSPIDPNEDQIRYILHTADNISHEDGVKAIVEAAGLTANAASFTQAGSDLTANLRMSIPFKTDNDYRTYIQYLQSICESCGSYITLNSDNEIEYHVLATPSSTDETTEMEILKDSVDVEINYRDIKTELTASNMHAEEIITQDEQSAAAVVSNDSARYLHEIEAPEKIEHVLDDITGRLPDLLDMRSAPKRRYRIDTATHNLDNIIGDDIKIVSDTIPGGDKQVKITEISKGSEKTSIEADDLGDL